MVGSKIFPVPHLAQLPRYSCVFKSFILLKIYKAGTGGFSLKRNKRLKNYISARFIYYRGLHLVHRTNISPRKLRNRFFRIHHQFIVVYSNINVDIVHGFVKDFIHPARDDTNCEVVFLNKSEPDLMFEGLL